MSAIRSLAGWRLNTPFYYGWLVLGVAALGAFAATGVAQIVLGGIQNLIFEDMGWDRSTIAFAVTAGTWTSGLLTPLVGRLADRHGPRGLMPVAALIVGVCYFGIAGIQSVWQFYLAYIIARTIANPNLVGVVPRTVAVNFFQRKRNLALGLTSMARPIGGAINIQIISLIAQAYTWRVAYRALGVFAIVLVVPLFLFMRRRPEDIGLLPDGDRRLPLADAHRAEAGESSAIRARKEFDWKAREAAATPTFWLIVSAEALSVMTAGAIGFQIVPFLKEADASQVVAAGALSLSSLFGALVGPGWGLLSDRFQARKLAVIALGATGSVTALFLVVGGGSGGFAVVVLWGTVAGGLNILATMMLAQYFGRASFGSIVGLMGPIQLGALGLGPTLGAVIFGWTGGYTVLFLYGVAAYTAAAVLIYSARPPRLPRRAANEGFLAGDE